MTSKTRHKRIINTPFIENLKLFNRKERFHLIGCALGNPLFTLSTDFMINISNMFRNEFVIPSTAFVAMDYHLDWIYASLFLASEKRKAGQMVGKDKSKTIFKRDETIIKANNEDSDLVIAFADPVNRTLSHLILLEAKGDDHFNNHQLSSKAERLKLIFPDNDPYWKEIVRPHFGILSRVEPKAIKINNYPAWMCKPGGDSLHWDKIPLPEQWQKITRCDQNGKNNKNGDYWKVDQR